MTIPTAITNLIDRELYANVQWKKLPSGLAKPLTDEMKAELNSRKTNAARVAAELQAERAQRPEAGEVTQANSWTLTNVAQLQDDQIPGRISYITDLIQSGEAEKYSFFSGNGDEQTTSIHQYLYWLQLRSKEIESDGTYTPDMFK
ncbi:hypothetical protein [Rhizobium sp. RU36D]|uniref:hypothetical protein n=1 Tax=Rhizobium sp. RU36D TaxID=1907415 RepID=UPI0009D8B087|nr:hypothetical protein [Rhizobium sp. RU36D]SMD02782.1 hypothetical protein SAMN05880593_11641 [Rhizobium sp. RU36D]